MKKAIHIAGSIIGVIVVYALAIAALAQNPPQKVQAQGPLQTKKVDCLLDGEKIDCGALPKPYKDYIAKENDPEIDFKARGLECLIEPGGILEICLTVTSQDKGSDWEDCKALAGPEGLQCRVLPNGRDIEVRSVAVDSDCKPPSCLPVSKDPVCSVGSEFVPCPSQKVRPAPFDVPAVHDNCDPQILTFCGPVSKVCDDATGKCKDVDPLDVPATPKYEEGDVDASRCFQISANLMHCPKPIPIFVGWACTDKSRFLLFSEDGKAHCLMLVP